MKGKQKKKKEKKKNKKNEFILARAVAGESQLEGERAAADPLHDPIVPLKRDGISDRDRQTEDVIAELAVALRRRRRAGSNFRSP